MIVGAPTWTGKSAAFVIACLQKIDYCERSPQALILAPTREKALDIHRLALRLALALGDVLKVRCHACVEGTVICDDVERFLEGQQLIVGTPGRVMHMIEERHFKVENVALFIVDEADQMFKEQICDINKVLPSNIQVALSCTRLPPDISNLTTQFNLFASWLRKPD